MFDTPDHLGRHRGTRTSRYRWMLIGIGLALVALLAGAAAWPQLAPPPKKTTVDAAPAALNEPASSPSATPTATPAPHDLPVIDYGPAPTGFPADPEPLSTTPITEGLHPQDTIGAYDAPGGRPRAFLSPTILGVPITMPIVRRASGWVAVLLPSANRTIAWVAPGDWITVPLRDQLVVHRRTHTLTWYRDGALKQTWPVTLGSPNTPTPLGRTFVLGRSALPGEVYAATDVLALGSVPDDPEAIPASLRGAHIGIHTWYNDASLGKDASDGCIRLTKSGQRLLLQEIIPGTEVVVLDE